MWKQTEKFPIEFKGMPGFESHDVTTNQIDSLNKLTPLVQSIFKEISCLPGKSPRALQKELLEFFVALQPSGFFICLGVRKTIGSQVNSLPPERASLLQGFTRLYTV